MLKYSEKLEKVAKENGYELKKELKNNFGYCYEYSFVKENDKIFFGRSGSVETYFREEDEIIDEMINGKPDYEKEFEEMFGF